MSSPEQHDIDALVKTALQLSPKARQRFLILLDQSMRAAVLRRLDAQCQGDDQTIVDFGLVDGDIGGEDFEGIEAPVDEPSSPTVVVVDPQDHADGQNNQGADLNSSDSNSSDSISGDLNPGDASSVDRSGSFFRNTLNQRVGSSVEQTIISSEDDDVCDRDLNGLDAKSSSSSQNRSDGDRPQGSGVYLVKLHAKGAIGEVFVAFDEKLAREVAIKRIRPELTSSPRRIKRFLREAVITAKLQHPGIVPIYNLSNSDGAPHYTMPLVSGVTMAAMISDVHQELAGTTATDRWMSVMRPLLRHFIAVCNTIDYAHTENVLHRDLKPSNIMIGSRGQTVVLDWGCAKYIELQDDDDLHDDESSDGTDDWADDDFVLRSKNDLMPLIQGDLLEDISDSDVDPPDITMSGSVMGTVEFMSPEQAAGKNELVGKPSDIFGLGATLFCLLTNARSFEHEGQGEVRTALREVSRGNFRRIEDVDSRVPPAISAICRRAMAFEPGDRYATAGDLGRDVEAFLSGEAVDAYAQPMHERIKRFVRRHQGFFGTLAAVLMVGFVGLIVLNLIVNRQKVRLSSLNVQLTQSVASERELRGRANRREDIIQRQLYGNQMLLASEASTEAGGAGRMRELVQKWKDSQYEFLRGWEWEHMDHIGCLELEMFKTDLTASQIITTRGSEITRVFDRHRLEVLAIGLKDSRVIDRDTVEAGCLVVDFNRDQTQIAMGHADGRVVVRKTETQKGAAIENIGHHEHSSKVLDLRYSGGSDLLASCDSQGNVVVWHIGDRKVVARGKGASRQPGKRLVGWSYDSQQLFWTTGRQIKVLNVDSQQVESLVSDGWIMNPCQSHEGELMAFIGPDNTVVVADRAGKILHRFIGHQLFVESLQWHPHMHLLLSSSSDGTVRIWNTDTKKEIRRFIGHEGHVYSAAFNAAGTRVVSGGLPEDAIRIWDVSNLGKAAFDRELQDFPAFDWLPDGDRLVVAEGRELLVQNGAGESRRIPARDPESSTVYAVDVHPTEDLVACVGGNGRIWTVDLNTGDVKTVFDRGGANTLFPAITSRGVQWSPDGAFLAGVGGHGELRIWNMSDNDGTRKDGTLGGGSSGDGKRPVPPLLSLATEANSERILSLAWQPNSDSGRYQLAAVGTGQSILIVDPRNPESVRRILQHGWKTGLAWSPDGKTLAVSDRRNVNLWNAEDGRFIKACDGPSAMVWDIDWSSSQNRFAALSEDGKVCLWHADTFAFLAKFSLHERIPYCVRWGPDGKRLVSTARHGRIVFQGIE